MPGKPADTTGTYGYQRTDNGTAEYITPIISHILQGKEKHGSVTVLFFVLFILNALDLLVDPFQLLHAVQKALLNRRQPQVLLLFVFIVFSMGFL